MYSFSSNFEASLTVDIVKFDPELVILLILGALLKNAYIFLSGSVKENYKKYQRTSETSYITWTKGA